MQELVQETLIGHPEILIAAAEKLDRQNAQAGQESLKQVLSQDGDFLFHDPNSPRIGARWRPTATTFTLLGSECWVRVQVRREPRTEREHEPSTENPEP